MAYRIRAVRKASREPRELLAEPAFFVALYERYRKAILVVSALLALSLAAGTTFWLISSSQDRQAWSLEDEASRLFHENPELAAILEKKELKDKSEHFNKALDLFEKIVQDYPRSSAAPVAQFYIGNTRLELKEYDPAIQAYQTYLDRYGRKSPLAPLVQTKLAYVFEQTGKGGEALKLFEEISENAQALNQDEAYYEMGRLYEASDKKADAIAAYEKSSQIFKDSPWSAEAQARLAVLKPTPAAATAPGTGGTPVPAFGSPAGQSQAPMIRVEKGPDGKMIVVPVKPGEAPPSPQAAAPPAPAAPSPADKKP